VHTAFAFLPIVMEEELGHRRWRKKKLKRRDGDKGGQQGLRPPYDLGFLHKISHDYFLYMVF
jgi:hypothetical protein